MTKEELEKKAENSYWDSEASGSMASKKCYVVGYIAGAKEMQEENEQLRQQIEKMRCCANCTHSIYYACELKECDNLDRWELAE